MAFHWVISPEAFIKENPGVIPADQRIVAVAWANPKGDRRSDASVAQIGGQLTARAESIPIQLEGEASAWPNLFARDPSAPDMWAVDQGWFFLVVITDKQLHAFGARPKQRVFRKSVKALPESAHYDLERIAEMRVDKKTHATSEMFIEFKDGSTIELKIGNNEAFSTAIQDFAAS